MAAGHGLAGGPHDGHPSAGGPPVRRVLGLLAGAAALVVLVELPASPRPASCLVLSLLLAVLAPVGHGVVARRGPAWRGGHVLLLLVLGFLLAAAGGPTLGATLMLVVVVVQAVLLLPLPAAAAVVLVVPLVHVGMSWQDGAREAFGTLVTSVFAAVVTWLLVREQRARASLQQAVAELGRLGDEVAALAAGAERVRVARDIHDGLGHHLTVVQVQVRAARAVLRSDPDRADSVLASAQEQAGAALAEVRRSVRALREPLLDVPLADALARLAEESSGVGPPTGLHLRGTARPLPADVAEVLYRAAQEGLTNVRRHAGAGRADVELDWTAPGQVRLLVRDDGRGPGDHGPGSGLTGLDERVRAHGGTASLRPAGRTGSVLDVQVPG